MPRFESSRKTVFLMDRVAETPSPVRTPFFFSHGMRILTASGQQPDRITPESIISGSFSTLRQCTGVSALTADRLPAGQICVGLAGSGLVGLPGKHLAGVRSSCSGGVHI
ncbi:uncharacterized protein PGTG_21603 [Puccinia graminis f. sp. tritici CRL 75-36-700-3]|uniref:Uncharacterized protein n=1 Tax=Puccinia graminis f. sp. tritici (strain CRL 75-36-700-3 / race SCCL) TaxID=418459 RepID=H6QS27_PUCGT|nr:uncharacterized protein PGTG_21603 [Puccinia graminis f. sp. tritici CRL 75-36-700-3]EHS63473.1 hypothetical protein PGTG_21603 [Puccinia graminis f. sp. tritici CRL 75-36-700-3]